MDAVLPSGFCSISEAGGSSLKDQGGDDSDFWVDAVDDVLIVAITDPEGTILYANDLFCEISGYSKQELVGANHRILNSGTHDPAFFAEMYRTIRSGRTWRGEICNRAKDGSLYWVATTIIPRVDAAGRITRFVACRFDITEQKLAAHNLREIATIDSLTGLLNRFGFQDELGRVLEHTAAIDAEAVVMMLDIDHFKDINDIYGHDVGDELLKIVAQRIRQSVRSTDLVARLGGDEIALVLAPCPSVRLVRKLVENLHNSLRETIELGIIAANVSASIGIASFPSDGRSANDLIKRADIALYKAKQHGRDRCEWFSPSMEESATRRMELQEEARLGIERNEFELFYQPVVSLETDRVVNCEALLRWRHPLRGLLTPGQFMEVFENRRLSVALGDHIQEAVIVQAAQWARAGVSFGKIAYNTTSADFEGGGFVDRLLERLDGHGADVGMIAVEVTEGMFLGQKAAIVRQELEQLDRVGVEVAFDDFGTGYASLTHLKELPIDRLKIDLSFIRDVTTDGDDRKIVRGLIDLAHSLGLTVTAEGIETVAQRDLLREMGCDRIQGYLLSRPVPAGMLPAVIRRLDEGKAGGRVAAARPRLQAASLGPR